MGTKLGPNLGAGSQGSPLFSPMLPSQQLLGAEARTQPPGEGRQVQLEEWEGVGWAGPASVTRNFYIEEKL